jgi:organic anion transporter 3A
MADWWKIVSNNFHMNVRRIFVFIFIFLRSVGEEERSFALGMQFVIFRLFGYIPAPILFGNLIDSTCLLWKSTCGEKGGRCLLYDIEQFRYK